MNEFWPNITLQLDKTNYIWKSINYYYYYETGKVIKACLGIKSHESENNIFGINLCVEMILFLTKRKIY